MGSQGRLLSGRVWGLEKPTLGSDAWLGCREGVGVGGSVCQGRRLQSVKTQGTLAFKHLPIRCPAEGTRAHGQPGTEGHRGGHSGALLLLLLLFSASGL